MGNSPTGTSESTEDKPDEEEPEIHPDQTDFDEHGTPETDVPDETETPTPPAGSGGGGGGGEGPGAAPVTTGGQETPEGDEPDDKQKEESPEAGDLEEPPESEQPEDTDAADHEDDDEEQEQNEAEITVYTGPWDITGWDNEPDLRRLQETFGDKLTVEYDFLPARKIEELEDDTQMPTVDDPGLPETTTESYRALCAAQEQRHAREYLRRLRIAALSEGRCIEDKDVLVELAEQVGLDIDCLREDMENIEVKEPESVEQTPQMEVTIADIPHNWTGNIEYGRVFGRLVGEGVRPAPTGKSLSEFVAEYEPVATAEVAETFELDRDQAVDELRQRENITRQEYDSGTFWITV